MERRIAALSPLAALGVLLMPPVLLVLPVKLFGAWLVLQGRIWLGMTVIVLIKLLGTAILARLFQLARPALMQMDWFARGYARWVGWKEALLQHVRASWPWRVGRVLKRALRRRWQAWRLRHGA